jgi:hypothetical protein
MTTNPHRLPQITNIESEVAQFRADAHKRVKTIQVSCIHDKIIDGGDRRICAACGLEEAYRYSWGSSTTVDPGGYEFARPAGQRSILQNEFAKKDSVVPYRVHT